ncbi:hypothetical protein Godav_006129 [Gossypium davidsonii]|uniref:Zinc finger GRF-type domain-containing protein n=2 Tax=Gossypium TaxID=3633 RepID=A0A7J8S3I1_GOSDV|nr:hypothetical protein [Gossypium davidsonii]MBA0655819.1 hypothetical protein [Gossypium klotzschianum]
MFSSTNRKLSAQRSVVDCHCGLRAPVCNANTPKNKGRQFFGCSKFKEWVEGDCEGTDSIVKEEGCRIDEIMLENKMLLTENKRLRLENDELNIDEMRRMRPRVTRLEEKIKLYNDKISRNNKLIVPC